MRLGPVTGTGLNDSGHVFTTGVVIHALGRVLPPARHTNLRSST